MTYTHAAFLPIGLLSSLLFSFFSFLFFSFFIFLYFSLLFFLFFTFLSFSFLLLLSPSVCISTLNFWHRLSSVPCKYYYSSDMTNSFMFGLIMHDLHSCCLPTDRGVFSLFCSFLFFSVLFCLVCFPFGLPPTLICTHSNASHISYTMAIPPGAELGISPGLPADLHQRDRRQNLLYRRPTGSQIQSANLLHRIHWGTGRDDGHFNRTGATIQCDS